MQKQVSFIIFASFLVKTNYSIIIYIL